MRVRRWSMCDTCALPSQRGALWNLRLYPKSIVNSKVMSRIDAGFPRSVERHHYRGLKRCRQRRTPLLRRMDSHQVGAYFIWRAPHATGSWFLTSSIETPECAELGVYPEPVSIIPACRGIPMTSCGREGVNRSLMLFNSDGDVFKTIKCRTGILQDACLHDLTTTPRLGI